MAQPPPSRRTCLRRFALPVFALAALALAPPAHAQYDDPTGEPPSPGACPGHTTKVTLTGMSFNPPALTVAPGTTVCWQNNEGLHTVTSNTGVFGSGPPAEAGWHYSFTFTGAGSYPYHCQVHGSPSFGMRGTVTVNGPDPAGAAGTLRFANASYSVGEGAGSATITVQRVDGDDGPVSVGWSAAAGTAAAGSDFTAAGGTLSWSDNDDTNKTFAVAIVNDGAAESAETVTLTLAAPTGGAALDPARTSATLTIQDNDSAPGPGTPAAPTNLAAAADPASTTEIDLTWSDNSNNEGGFRIEERTVGGSYQEVATVGANTTAYAFTAQPGSFHLFRVRASGGAGVFSPYSNEASASANDIAAPCVAGLTTACVNNGNFQVVVEWRTASASGDGSAVPLPTAPDSALFYFFNSGNIEQLVKVLNGCGVNNRYWVFWAATTNVEFALTVTDTRNGRTKSYFNPLDRPAPPIQDTSAFATCP